MGEITLTINDTRVTVPDGITILEAAAQAEIYIPTLCYHPSLPTSKGLEPNDFVYRGEDKIATDSQEAFEGCWSPLSRQNDAVAVLPGLPYSTEEGSLVAEEGEVRYPNGLGSDPSCQKLPGIGAVQADDGMRRGEIQDLEIPEVRKPPPGVLIERLLRGALQQEEEILVVTAQIRVCENPRILPEEETLAELTVA